MPYKISDRTLPVNRPWSHQDIHYPAKWLSLSTEEDRAALGIVWEADPPAYNDNFYTGFDSDGNLIPKDHAELIKLWVRKTNSTANGLLSGSDWRVIKAKECGSTMNADWKSWRQTIRTECRAMVTAIEATADTAALQEYVEGDTYDVWTADPDNTAE